MQTENFQSCETVGIFENQEKANRAISDLKAAGFEREDISLLSKSSELNRANESIMNIRLLDDNPSVDGTAEGGKEELIIGQGVLISIGIFLGALMALMIAGSLSLPAPVLAIVVIGAICGMGIGSILASALGSKYNDYFQKQISRGNQLLWVNAENEELQYIAKKIMRNAGAKQVLNV